MRLGVATVIVAMGFGAAGAWADDAPLKVRVQSTTDTVDSGLYDALIKTEYKKLYPNDDLDYKYVGTGAALTNARNGLADAVVTHAPTSEAKFVSDGYSLEPYGRAIFYSDYVIVGPADDPAGVAANAAHDAITAYERIAAAGAAGKATFYSRADASGTNVQEQLMWGDTSTVPLQPADPNLKPTAAQKEPVGAGGTGTYPDWYKRGGSGTTQAQNLDATSACQATTGGCYTMLDRGTFNYRVNQGLDTNLVILADKNTPDVRGGQNLLVNPFSVYIVNPDKFADGSKPNVEAGRRFADLLTSADFQQKVLGYPTASNPAFFSDAFPKVDATVPTTAYNGSVVPLSATFTDKLPGGAAVAGLPAQLQASTDGGATFTNLGTPVPTDAHGAVAFTALVSSTTTYRVSLPRYQKFSPFTQDLGVVAGVPVVTPTPIATPTPDKTAPTVSRAAFSTKSLSLTVSEKSTITVVVAKKVVTKKKGSKKSTTSYKTAKTIKLSASAAGVVKTTFKTLKPATYRLTITTTDAAGNVKKQVVSVVLKAKKSVTKTLK
ncbi:MAG: substrate-binding domain-containing protein [Solirubrobacteraceae bacterium]|nr:substrate-binding domain-containing protein [Patulibacter sp.]